MAVEEIKRGVYQECTAGNAKPKNTGALEQCLEGIIIRTALGDSDLRFDSIEKFKDKTEWDKAIAEKKLFPLYDVEEPASANTEDTYFEGRNKKYKTASGKKVLTYNSMLSLCSHSALKSFNGKEMQLFEFTEDNAITGVSTSDGKVKGQDVTIEVGKRMAAMPDKPPYSPVTVTYKDFNQFEDHGVIARPEGWTAAELTGIFDVHIKQVSASATAIKFTVSTGCAGGGNPIGSFEAGDIIVKDALGAVETVSFIEADPNGIYQVAGEGFANGFTVSLNGIVSQTNAVYEAVEPLVVKIG